MNMKKQLTINMLANFVNFGVSLCISFFLSPYIVRTIGVEANGFITLANNFTGYASIITIALNSMAGRFVTVSLYEDKPEEANRYFTSAFYANLLITAVLAVVGAVVVIFLERLVNIPAGLVWDVKLLFICLFLNCLLSVAGSVFSVATFVKNKLYLSYLRGIQTTAARALVIVGCFALFSSQVWFVGLGSLISGIMGLFYNVRYTRTLMPEVKIQRKHFKLSYIVTLVKAGVWNTVNRLGQLLLGDLDLLITNLFIDATSMGVLSLAKTVPNLIGSLMGSIVGVFSPNFTILYAQKKYDELLEQIGQAMKIMGVVTNLSIVVLVVCGADFFRLWQPTQDPRLLQVLSILTVGVLIFSGGINCIYNIFTVVNKLKLNSIVVLINGVLSTALVFILVQTTELGIFAVAGVSTLLSILRNLVFTAPYGAHCLHQKWYVFYPNIFKPVLFSLLSSVLCLLVLQFLPTGGWLLLCVKGVCTVLLSGLIGFYVIFNRDDRNYVISAITRRLHHG